MSIIVEELHGPAGKLGILLFNRPQNINALDLDMCRTSLEALTKWKQDPELKCVLIHGNGEKGLCAGGDVKTLRERLRSEGLPYAIDFFAYEYGNDLCVATYPKPIVAWGSGITMGGGIGVFQGASHRVSTETSVYAMPEIHIGLFPDVGASYFLNRLPEGVGLLMGLTAARLGPHDALDVGLSDFFIPHSSKGLVIDELASSRWSSDPHQNHILVADVLNGRKRPLHFASTVSKLLTKLSTLASPPSVKAALDTILEMQSSDPWLAECAANLKSASPLSLRVTFELLRRSSGLHLRECFEMEYKLAIRHCIKSDFDEGVRVRLIDKGAQPRWLYPDVKSIPQDAIDLMFSDPFTHEIKQFQNRFLDVCREHGLND